MQFAQQIDSVINHVAHATGIARAAILGKSRVREVCDARHLVVWITIRSFPRITCLALARALGMHHTNVIKSYAHTQTILIAYPSLRQEWEAILANLRHPAL